MKANQRQLISMKIWIMVNPNKAKVYFLKKLTTNNESNKKDGA